MTRASKPESMATGFRSCRMTRSMISLSACSNILRLFQESLQLFPGALDPHLQGRNPRPSASRDLLVFAVLDVLEQKRLSGRRREPGAPALRRSPPPCEYPSTDPSRHISLGWAL